MTVALTGDVHQWIESADRPYTSETESALALDYARVAGRHGLKVTLFFTGRAITEDVGSLDALLAEKNVEIGGHGWDSFRPHWRYRALNKFFGSPHGSSAMQARMVRRTCAAVERVTAHRVLSWRNHAYCHDSNTPDVLANAGIRVWSDVVGPEYVPYRHGSGLTVLPINTTPDHEHLYHGGQTVASVPAARRMHYHDPDSWRERILYEAESISAAGGVATILAHPLCMKVVDDWQTFERLCSALSRYPTAWAMEASESLPGLPEE